MTSPMMAIALMLIAGVGLLLALLTRLVVRYLDKRFPQGACATKQPPQARPIATGTRPAKLRLLGPSLTYAVVLVIGLVVGLAVGFVGGVASGGRYSLITQSDTRFGNKSQRVVRVDKLTGVAHILHSRGDTWRPLSEP